MARWIAANTIGFGLGFFIIMQVVNIVEFGQLSWSETVGTGIRAYLARPASLLAAGAFLGLAQSIVLRSSNIPLCPWVMVTAAGFCGATLVIWPLMATGNWGGTEAPIEPIVNIVGGGSCAGIAQYFYLRHRSGQAGRWLALWITGLVISVIPTAAFFMIFVGKLGMTFSWPVEVIINGSINGAVAAAASAAAFYHSLKKSPISCLG